MGAYIMEYRYVRYNSTLPLDLTVYYSCSSTSTGTATLPVPVGATTVLAAALLITVRVHYSCSIDAGTALRTRLGTGTTVDAR